MSFISRSSTRLARQATLGQVRWRSSVRPASLMLSSSLPPTAGIMPIPFHHSPSSRTTRIRYFSSLVVEDEDDTAELYTNKPIRILYGSQGGTAQIFCMQLADALEETFPERQVDTMSLDANRQNLPQTLSPDCVNVLLTSVAGVGEPPDNARDFYNWLMSDAAQADDWDSVEYCVFGLGNLKAHPNHFNVIGKIINARLQELGATRIQEIGLGDDSECIEDDFDVWQEEFLSTLANSSSSMKESTSIVEEAEVQVLAEVKATPAEDVVKQGESTTTRIMSTKYPELTLLPPQTDVVREDLFHLQSTDKPFYQNGFEKLNVTNNRLLSVRSAEYGLRELVVSLEDSPGYQAGDHFVMYPKNAYCMVEAYVELLGVDPHTVIQEPTGSSKRQYPHPTGITLFETLLHCVDLGAVPSPAFSRELLGTKDIDYKNDIANPRRTVLNLALESKRPVSLEDLLYNLSPMQPRYYSIASSPLVHPSQVYLTYRPVKYVTSRGAIREGTCTSYMQNLDSGAEVVGKLNSNPSFRLPTDPKAPVLLMAGGCGIAAIRAFMEERLAQASSTTFGTGILFLGFRTPRDEVYRDMVDYAIDVGVLTDAQVSYTSGCVEPEQQCQLVSDTVRANGKQVFELLESGGYAYLCGGARTFGAAIEHEVIEIIQEHGNMNEEEAVAYLRNLIKDRRFCEDLAD